MAPCDEDECRQMLYTATTLDGPAAVRYPRGRGPGVTPHRKMKALPVGRAQLRREGRGIALLAFGSTVAAAMEVAERLDATVVNMRFVKPLDTGLVERMADAHDLLVTLEDNTIIGGAGSAVCEHLAVSRPAAPVLRLGLPDHFLEHGSREDCLAAAGLDAEGIETSIRRWCESHDCGSLRERLVS